ncbi:MAG: hypothetical protein AAGH65_09290 [Pseudomonadota bacterium]
MKSMKLTLVLLGAMMVLFTMAVFAKDAPGPEAGDAERDECVREASVERPAPAVSEADSGAQ